MCKKFSFIPPFMRRVKATEALSFTILDCFENTSILDHSSIIKYYSVNRQAMLPQIQCCLVPTNY